MSSKKTFNLILISLIISFVILGSYYLYTKYTRKYKKELYDTTTSPTKDPSSIPLPPVCSDNNYFFPCLIDGYVWLDWWWGIPSFSWQSALLQNPNWGGVYRGHRGEMHKDSPPSPGQRLGDSGIKNSGMGGSRGAWSQGPYAHGGSGTGHNGSYSSGTGFGGRGGGGG